MFPKLGRFFLCLVGFSYVWLMFGRICNPTAYVWSDFQNSLCSVGFAEILMFGLPMFGRICNPTA